MATLDHKIDLAGIIIVNKANPNGDPLNGNRPRYSYAGIGEISDVAIKRKIRNRLMQEGYAIFVQSDDNRMDEYPNLRARAEQAIPKAVWKDKKEFARLSCEKWLDVRAFGQVFAYKGASKGAGKDASKEGGLSIGIRGPVSLHPAFSVAPVGDRITSIQITKSVSGDKPNKTKTEAEEEDEDEVTSDGRASDTMGMKHRVDHGVYVFYGSMNPQLASRTGFSNEDADAIKEALRTLFRNDASSARPEGSMELYKLYWWEHNSPNGQYSSAKVHRLLKVTPKVDTPASIEDYEITLDSLQGLGVEVIEGE